MSVDSDVIPRHVVNSALRLNLPYFAVACAIAIGGTCSLLLARLRSRDRLLLWVGVFSMLYAARLFIQNELVRDAFNAPGTEYRPFFLSITYAINIPFALFALELLGRGWKASIRIWVWLCSAFAVIAISFCLFAHQPPWLTAVNSALVVGGTLLLLSVAGDFYDFHVFDGLLTILVADVSGHGVAAALVAGMLKVCFAAQKSNASNPAAILSGLGLMLRGSLGGQYVTAACVTVDTKSRTITYAGAGHPPSVLVRAQEGDTVLLDRNGLFLGPFPNATYENMSLPFRRGDRLFVYTDGITEARAFDGEELGRERLEQFLVQSNGTAPNSALDRLFQKITTGTPEDDLTAVLLHFD